MGWGGGASWQIQEKGGEEEHAHQNAPLLPPAALLFCFFSFLHVSADTCDADDGD